jgi:hypothetical protein
MNHQATKHTKQRFESGGGIYCGGLAWERKNQTQRPRHQDLPARQTASCAWWLGGSFSFFRPHEPADTIPMAIDPTLRSAYEHTTYQVDLPAGPVAIRIGQRHPALDRFLRGQGAANWCFLTAWNPMSEPTSPEENARRQGELIEAVQKGGWAYWPGEGIGDGGNWPPEPSLLIAGVKLPAARALARRFRQAAFVYGTLGGLAQLEEG